MDMYFGEEGALISAQWSILQCLVAGAWFLFALAGAVVLGQNWNNEERDVKNTIQLEVVWIIIALVILASVCL